jgi:Xaa-Pro dipeptidase
MQSMHTVLKRGALVWVRELVPPELFPPRVARVQEAIAAAGHDAWLVFGDAYRYGDLAYLTHFLPRVRGALALVPRTGEPALLVAVGSRDIPAAKTLTWVDDVRPYTRLPGEVAKLIRERGLERATVGLVGVEEQLAVGDWDRIRGLLPEVRWKAADGTLAALRTTKHATELGAIRHVAGLVRAGLAMAAEELRPGVTERAVWAAVDRRLRYGAAEDVRLLVASGPRASTSLRPPDDRALESGDVVLLHLAAEYQRYWAEGGQTFVLGAPDAAQQALAAAASRALSAMTAAIRPGAPASAPADAALQTIAQAAPPLSTQHSALSTSYGLGHGIGLDLEEAPWLRPGETTPLPEGAVLALHVVLHGEAGRGALATQMFVVGANGAESLLAPEPLQAVGG